MIVQFIKRISLLKIRYIISFFVAYIVYFFQSKKKGDCWVFGTGTGLFENNIEALFKYCESLGYSCLFITNKKKVVQSFDSSKVLKRGSIEAYLACLNAKVLLFDNDYSDLAPGFMFVMQALKVNVNHGQEGFKRLPKDYYSKIKADITCSVSQFEKNIKVNECGAPVDTVFITGLARYDNLTFESSSNDILMFLTWRDELQYLSDDEIELTSYYKNCVEFLESSELASYLEKKDATLYFKPHYRMKNINLKVNNSRVVICNQDVNLTELIKNTKVLITDYSSVAWDYIYTNRNVIFFQFDYDKYSINPGLYILEDNNLLKNRVRTALELRILFNSDEVSCTSGYIDDGKYFAFIDKNNCNRIVNKINALNLND
ncbi:CDP-glycerol glycerophosphotransferase family protein [Vibrio parahaemolyticus]|uniref:CDP-glycerol glycerophosphotransferase family protein n=1 Tax=Vibrio parahaemolyticus TaxID=670 RepID=UPI000423BDAB|nr:CDP-glycerol glycerophosphotransferase family protein [Vibrio parahaemolyticus]